MAAVLPFERRTALAPVTIDPVAALPLHARAEAERRLSIIRPAMDRVRCGVAVSAAAKWLATQGADMPSEPTLERWLSAYKTGGLIALAPKREGKKRKERGWEAKALELYGSKGANHPHYSTVALWLREKYGFADAADHRVKRYLKSAPSDITETAPGRLGRHYVQQNVKPYVMRDNTVLPVGFIYEGDGHQCDVYVAAPATGNPYRPEITVWIDVRSHFIVGWWLSEAESANTTLFSLSAALLTHDHVPSMVHADVGSGFIAKTITDEQTGYLARFSIEPIFALPGNAKGKGLIEGFWRWFEERCGKQFNTYCGHDRTDDYLRHLTSKVERGLITLPTLSQYAEAIREYFAFYNRNPQKGLGCAPRDLWAQLERVPVETPAAAVIRPRDKRTVRRWSVALHNRIYRGGELARYEGREVMVEYDLHNDMHVVIQDMKGRYICQARLVEKQPWLPDSRIEEGMQKRLEGQRLRLENKIEEFSIRARHPISGASLIEALESGEVLPPRVESNHLVDDISRGYAIAPPAAAIAAPAESTPKAINAAIAARVAEQAADDDIVEETREQRYQRFIDVQAASVAGTHISEAQLNWATGYSMTSECRAFERLREEFGVVPGVRFPSST